MRLETLDCIIDHRHKEIGIGDEVVYLPPPAIGEHGDVRFPIPVPMKTARVVSMVADLDSGFAEAGHDVTITLSDGSVLTGDSENGGWNCLKLDQGKYDLD